MALLLSMWNFHNWFCQRGIAHTFSIRSNENTISRVQLGSVPAPAPGCAVLSHVSAPSEYTCTLSSGDDRIYFRAHTPFEIMDELDYMFMLYSHWEQALKRVNLTHGSLETLLALCNELLPCPIIVHCGDKLLAVSPQHRETLDALWRQFYDLSLGELLHLLPPESAVQYASRSPVLFRSPLHDGRQVLFVSVVSPSGRRVRITAAAGDRQFSPGDIHIMRCFAEAVQQNIALHETQVSHRILRPSAFFAAYVRTGVWNEEQAAVVLRRLGWTQTQKYTVFRIELRTPSDTLLMDKLYQTLHRACPDACCVLCGEAVHLIGNVSLVSGQELREHVRHAVPSSHFIISQSNFSTDFSALPQLFAQAEKTLRQARLKNLAFLFSGDLIGEYIRQALHEQSRIQALIHPAVRILRDTDRTQQTAYTETLHTYLRCGENCSAAAKQLGIHRSTLLARLEHIRTLTGIALDDPQEQQALYLSILAAG